MLCHLAAPHADQNNRPFFGQPLATMGSQRKKRPQLWNISKNNTKAEASSPYLSARQGSFFYSDLGDLLARWSLITTGAVHFTLSGLPPRSGLSLDIAAPVLSGTPTQADVVRSPLKLQLQAQDFSGVLGELPFVVDVAASSESTNRPPVFLAVLSPLVVDMGARVSVDLSKSFTDPDGDILSFFATGLSPTSGLKVTPDGELTGRPNAADAVGPQPAVLEVSALDVEGSKVSGLFYVFTHVRQPSKGSSEEASSEPSNYSEEVRAAKATINPILDLCQVLGWDAARVGSVHVCGSDRVGPEGSCAEPMLLEGARAMCQTMGARLCTSRELFHGEATSSNSCDESERVWTTSACNAGDGNQPGLSAKSQAAGAAFMSKEPVHCSQVGNVNVPFCARKGREGRECW